MKLMIPPVRIYDAFMTLRVGPASATDSIGAAQETADSNSPASRSCTARYSTTDRTPCGFA